MTFDFYPKEFPQLADNGRKQLDETVGFNQAVSLLLVLESFEREMFSLGLAVLNGRPKLHLGLFKMLDVRRILPSLRLVS